MAASAKLTTSNFKMRLPTLVIGNKNYSSWSLRPWFFLRKNKIKFEEEQLWLDEPDFKTTLAAYNSGGKVPVLRHGDLIVWDSLAIIEYAIERFNCADAWPRDPALRAHARSSVCEMHSSFSALRSECPMDIRNRYTKELGAATHRDIRRISRLWTQALEMSDSRGRWLYGDFSVADAMFAPVAFRFTGYGVSLSPLLQAYVDHVLDDPVLGGWVRDAHAEGHHLDYQ